MSKQNLTEADLKAKGLVETSRGVFERGKVYLIDTARIPANKTLKEIVNDVKSGDFSSATVFDFRKAIQYATDNFWLTVQANCNCYSFNVAPNTKPRQSSSDRWKKRKCVMQYRAFADTMRSQATMLNYHLTSPLIVEFHIPMPKSWGNKKRAEMDGKLHTQTPDCDNLCKAIGDTFLGQDNLISEIHARKIWSTTGRIIIYA